MGKGKTRRRKKKRAPEAQKAPYVRALLRVGGVIAALLALAALVWGLSVGPGEGR